MRKILDKFTKKGIRDFLRVCSRGKYRHEINLLVRPALLALSLGLPAESEAWLETLKTTPSACLPGMALYAHAYGDLDQDNVSRFEDCFEHCSDEVDNMLYTIVSLSIAVVVAGIEPDKLEDSDARVLLETFPH